MRKLAVVAVFLLGGLLVGGAVFYAFMPEIEAESSCQRVFVIDQDFEQVRKIMVRTNPLRQLVELRGNRLVEHKFEQLNFSLERLREPNWHIDGKGWFIVETNNEHLGKQLLFFGQKVYVTKYKLEAVERLQQPAGRLNYYCTNIQMEPDVSGGTKVVVSVYIRYCRKATEAYRHMIQRGVNEAANKEAETTERGLKVVTDRYRNAILILPQNQ